jgi:hypothetical protein
MVTITKSNVFSIFQVSATRDTNIFTSSSDSLLFPPSTLHKSFFSVVPVTFDAFPFASVCFHTRWNKIGKAYSLEYANIPKTFLTPNHIGRCCTFVIPVHCCFLVSASAILALMPAQTIFEQHCLPTMTFDRFCSSMIRSPIVAQQWAPNNASCWVLLLPNSGFQQWNWLMRAVRHDQPMRCSSLTPGRKEHVVNQRWLEIILKWRL